MNTSVSTGNALALTGSHHQATQNTQQRNITKKIIGASVAALSFTAAASYSHSKGRAIKTDANNLRSAFPAIRDLKRASGSSSRPGTGAAAGYAAGYTSSSSTGSGKLSEIPEATFTVTLNNTQTGETQFVSLDVAGFNTCTWFDQHKSIARSVYSEAGNSLEQLKAKQTLFAIKEGDEKVWQLSDYSLASTKNVHNKVGVFDSLRPEQTIDRGRLFRIGGADGLPRHRYTVSKNTPSGIADAIKSAIKNSAPIQDAEKNCGARKKAFITIFGGVVPAIALGVLVYLYKNGHIR